MNERLRKLLAKWLSQSSDRATGDVSGQVMESASEGANNAKRYTEILKGLAASASLRPTSSTLPKMLSDVLKASNPLRPKSPLESRPNIRRPGPAREPIAPINAPLFGDVPRPSQEGRDVPRFFRDIWSEQTVRRPDRVVEPEAGRPRATMWSERPESKADTRPAEPPRPRSWWERLRESGYQGWKRVQRSLSGAPNEQEQSQRRDELADQRREYREARAFRRGSGDATLRDAISKRIGRRATLSDVIKHGPKMASTDAMRSQLADAVKRVRERKKRGARMSKNTGVRAARRMMRSPQRYMRNLSMRAGTAATNIARVFGASSGTAASVGASAAAAAGPAAIAVAAIAAVAVMIFAMYKAAKAVVQFAESVIQQNEKFKVFSPTLANAYARIEYQQRWRDIQYARQTSPSQSRMMEEYSRLQDDLLQYKVMYAQVRNMALAGGMTWMRGGLSIVETTRPIGNTIGLATMMGPLGILALNSKILVEVAEFFREKFGLGVDANGRGNEPPTTHPIFSALNKIAEGNAFAPPRDAPLLPPWQQRGDW